MSTLVKLSGNDSGGGGINPTSPFASSLSLSACIQKFASSVFCIQEADSV